MNDQSIFIVEDEIIIAKSIAKNIQKFGYQLAGIAISGYEALEKILETKPNLVLMDILLEKSDLDGIAVAQKIQSQINVPIIYLTAHSDRATLNRAKITAPFGYILKPYSKKDLQISIELALHKHQQETQLAKREELLSTILNATQDGVVATNNTSKIIYMNSAAQRLTGWDLTEAYNREATEILRIIDEQSQEPLIDPIKQVLEQGQVIYLDEHSVLIKKDGEQTSIDDSISPIVKKGESDDRVEGAVLVFHTRRNSGSAQNKNQQQNLATLATNKQLNELSAYFMEIILHKLRSPLTVILSTSESLQNYRHKWTVQKQSQNFDRIQQATRQITWILDNVTVWAELGREEITLHPDWIDIITLSEEILSNLRLFERENHELVISHQGDEQIFYLDRDILSCILNNLLLNAIKYSPEGSKVTLDIDSTKDNLVLRIQDRGRGIPAADRKRVFEPFYRASNTENIKGTGLGLAIIKEYVQLCQGKIEIESSSPSGTTFVVNLPL